MNERCAYQVCDEDDDHAPDCTAWQSSQTLDGADAPYPGMASAFEAHYGQSWTDPAWRTEAAAWAAAWKAAQKTPGPTSPEIVLDSRLVSALDAMCDEFRAHDLPYGSKAYQQANALLNQARHAKSATPTLTLFNPKEQFHQYFQALEGFCLRSERFYEDLDAPNKEALARTMTKWLEAAFTQGAQALAQDTLATLLAYGTATAGLTQPMRNPTESYDAVHDALQSYYYAQVAGLADSDDIAQGKT